jgi:hypothetical protein
VTTSVEISKLDERLQTRILDRRLCKIVDIQVPAYNRAGDEIRKPKKTSSRKQGSMDSIS